MGWEDWRCRSQITLRRAPRTGMQLAKRVKTRSPGARGSDVISVRISEALRDRFAEGRAGVPLGAVGPALDEAQERRLGGQRGVEGAEGHRHELPAFRGEALEEAGVASRALLRVRGVIGHGCP